MSMSNAIAGTSSILMNAHLTIQRNTMERQESAAEESSESAAAEASESRQASDGIRGKLLDLIG